MCALQKAEALDGNLQIPILSSLHESLGAARTESTYVADRLAGEPKHGPVTNIPAPVAPAPIFGAASAGAHSDTASTHSGNSVGRASVRSGGSKNLTTNTTTHNAGAGNAAPGSDTAADDAFNALAALEGTAGSRCASLFIIVVSLSSIS